MLAPLAPHIAEELWSRLGHEESLAWEAFPVADEALLVDDTVEVPVQVNGKVRSVITRAGRRRRAMRWRRPPGRTSESPPRWAAARPSGSSPCPAGW